MDSGEALREVDQLWSEIDTLRDMAEARIRILQSQIKSPELAEAPEWLRSATKEARETLESLPPRRWKQLKELETAERLIRGVLFLGPDLVAEIDTSNPSIEIHWVDSPLKPKVIWSIHPSRGLNWPGVNVRVYYGLPDGWPILTHRSYHTAFSVIESTFKFLASENA